MAKIATPNAGPTVYQLRPDRLPPPPDLPASQRDVWVSITHALPAVRFDGAHAPLLLAFVRHAATADALSRLIAAFDPELLKREDGLRRLDTLTAMRAQETKGMLGAPNALSLTQLRSLRANKAFILAHKTGGTRKPWDRSRP